MRNIRFAFALDADRQFADKNFSMAAFFQFNEYQVGTKESTLISEVANPSLAMEDEQKYSCLTH